MPRVPRPPTPDTFISPQTAIENREVAEKLNGNLSFGKRVHGQRTGNIDGQWLLQTINVESNTAVKVFHGLGRVPQFFIDFPTGKAVSVYPVLMDSWTEEVFYVASDAKGFDVWLAVF